MTREEAIQYLQKLYLMADITDEYGDMDDTTPYETSVDMAIEALSDAPETNVGKWLIAEQDKYMVHSVRCSVCGYCISWMANYCPHCGAKMEGEQENG